MQSFDKKINKSKAIAEEWLELIFVPQIYRTLMYTAIPMAGVAAMLLLAPGDLEKNMRGITGRFIAAPFAFALWLQLMNQLHGLKPRFNPWLAGISVICFVGATYAYRRHIHMRWEFTFEHMYWMIGAVLAGLLAYVDLRKVWACILKEKRAIIIMLIAAAAPFLYAFLQDQIWDHMSKSSAFLVNEMVNLMGVDSDAWFEISQGTRPTIVIASSYFNVQVYADCSGLEGIFFFYFLMSCMLLIDWKFFRHMSLFNLYLFGFIYMYCFNILRISLLYVLGTMARTPGASSFMRQFEGAAWDYMHQWTGVFLYLVAFGIFAMVMYFYNARIDETESEKKPTEEAPQ